MDRICLDREWTYRKGLLDSVAQLKTDPGKTVSLPHDGMIGTPVSPDAPARSDMGYFTGGLSSYTKTVMIPGEWKDGCVGLQIDGAMMNAVVDVNGCRVTAQHYGYAPFYADLTDLAEYGAENRITVNVNSSMQPNSRWYTGSGLYRGVKLVHGPKVHIVPDGIFALTREVSDGIAFLEVLTEIRNSGTGHRLAEAEAVLTEEGSEKAVAGAKQVIRVGAGTTETARVRFSVDNPRLWSAEEPNLYRVKVRVNALAHGFLRFCPGLDSPVSFSNNLGFLKVRASWVPRAARNRTELAIPQTLLLGSRRKRRGKLPGLASHVFVTCSMCD